MNDVLPSHHHSSGLEKILEHRFVSELATRLWLQGCRDLEVLRSEVDAGGYDIVVEARGVLRHIQLKSMMRGGKRASITANVRLAAKPSPCIVWYDYDPVTLELGPFRWFGTAPTLGLPDLGDDKARHTKGDASGNKKIKPDHRILRKSRFTIFRSMYEIVAALFGYPAGAELELLRQQLDQSGTPELAPDWVLAVRAGELAAIPVNLDWDASLHLAHLVDGYGVCELLGLGDPFEFQARHHQHANKTGKWTGGPAALWTTLFLEHRRVRQAGFEPEGEEKALLDRLCLQLSEAIRSAV